VRSSGADQSSRCRPLSRKARALPRALHRVEHIGPTGFELPQVRRIGNLFAVLFERVTRATKSSQS